MALKTILLRKKLSDKQAEEQALREKVQGFGKREAEIAKAIEEAKTEEEKATVERAVEEFDTDKAAADKELRDAGEAIKQLEAELREAEEAQETAIEEQEDEETRDGAANPGRRREEKRMSNKMELREAQEFQTTGRHEYKDVRSMIRSTLLSTGTTNPTGVGGINDFIGGPSALIDMIRLTDCTGMGSYKVAVMTGDATAAQTTEGTVPSESEPTFTTKEITPQNYATIAYISKEIRKMTPLNYEEKVRGSARFALRRVLNTLAITKALASDLNTTLELTDAGTDGAACITATTLSDIILEYGGDEAVEGNAVLLLNKADLKAFAAVRGKNEYLPVYTIVPDAASPSTGIIKDNFGLSCRYCLSNDLTALSTAVISGSPSKHMLYGKPQCIEMGLFGGFEVEVNDGYKFGEGLLTIRGNVSAGADVTVKNGFVVVTAKQQA